MKKVLFLLMAAVVMSMSFAACSDKKGIKIDDENTENVEAEDEEEESEEMGVADVADFSEVSGNPGEQYVALTKEFINFVKSTHINSLTDVEALYIMAEGYKISVEALQEDLQNMSSDEQLEAAGQMSSIIGELSGDLEKEVERLEQEAADAGVYIDDLDLE